MTFKLTQDFRVWLKIKFDNKSVRNKRKTLQKGIHGSPKTSVIICAAGTHLIAPVSDSNFSIKFNINHNRFFRYISIFEPPCISQLERAIRVYHVRFRQE